MKAAREVEPGSPVIEMPIRPALPRPTSPWRWKPPPCPCARDIRTRRLPCEEGWECPA